MKLRIAFRVSHAHVARRATLGTLGLALAAGCLWGISPPAAFAGTDGAFQVAANPGGGSILTGTLGSSSLPAATGALMRRVHAELGTRPTVVQSVVDTPDHTLTLLFTAARNNVPYTGVAIVTANSGAQTAGAALYDVTARFHATVGPRIRRKLPSNSPRPNR